MDDKSSETLTTYSIMDKLPQPILDKIIELIAEDAYDPKFLPAHKMAVAPYAIVSSRFREAVERITFHGLILCTTDIPEASSILARYSRWMYLKGIRFNIALWPYDGAALAQLETTKEKKSNSYLFSANIEVIFKFFQQWPGNGTLVPSEPAPIALYMAIHSATDVELKIYSDVLTYYGPDAVGTDIEIWRYHRSLLRLDDRPLPSLEHVPISELHFPTEFYRRNIDPSSLSRIASFMNSTLKTISWAFNDVEKKDLSVRRAYRQQYIAPRDHDFQPPVLYGSKEEDGVSCAIRKLCQRTKVVRATGLLGSTELFWPKKISDSTPEPHFEALEQLKITFHPLTPRGKWMFGRDWREEDGNFTYIDLCPEPDEIRGPEDNQWNLYRHAPKQRFMDKFYEALGKAVARMPKVRVIVIRSTNYLVSRQGEERTLHRFVFKVYEDRKARASWLSNPEYKPSDSVVKVWKKSAYELALDLTVEASSTPNPDNHAEDMEIDEPGWQYEDADAVEYEMGQAGGNNHNMAGFPMS
ncbi:hypothetical protein ABKA04_004077 [Annulohypoxylon sp. FPYF3050]